MLQRRETSEKKVKYRVIYVFIACCMALGLAFAVSKVSFNQMLETVDNLGKPNEKVNLVTKISREILQLDQQQRSQFMLEGSFNANLRDSAPSSFGYNTEVILKDLNTLKTLYTNNPLQISRIDSISNLLEKRNDLFLSYVQLRKSLINNSTFNKQLNTINEILLAKQNPDTVYRREKITQTTVLNPQTEPRVEQEEEKDNRGFFSKLLGLNKEKEKEPEPVPILPDRTVHEELTIQIDTTTHSQARGAVKEELNQAIKHLEAGQESQKMAFNNREIELTIAGNLLINHIIGILSEVEAEAQLQTQLDTQNAQLIVNQSVSKITYILIVSLLITSVLIYLILADIRKANRYRLELEKAKEDAEYHSAAKQRFLSNMSHELRTPLQSIIGYTEQLKNAHSDDKNIEIIYHASEHLLQIVNELLDYNRIISGRFVLQQETVYLPQLVHKTIATMQQHADDKNLVLSVEEQIKGSGYVLGDPFRLKQILFNLVSNAVKFTNHGEIVVTLKAIAVGDLTRVTFLVKDTGVGIAEQDKEKIFNEFEQGSYHNSGEKFGSGLGLSIVKSLVTEMNGKLKLESQLGVGSEFTVELNLITSEKAVLLPTKNEKRLLEPHVGTVWVVDDDSFILELCSTILSNNLIPHQTFISPLDMLETPFDGEVTHILMDMRMPGLSGKELRHLMKQRIPSSVKIIAFTAQALPEERKNILAEGFDGLLIKPFREAELLDILNISPKVEKGRFSPEMDLGILPFVYEDPKELIKIISRFVIDTREDLATLKQALLNENPVDSEIIFHRLAGRCAQLGQEKIAFNLRKCEIDARSGEVTSLEEFNRIEKQIQYFIEFLLNKDKVTV